MMAPGDSSTGGRGSERGHSLPNDAERMSADELYSIAQQELQLRMLTGPAWSAGDRSRAELGRFPDFLVVGAQKAGTTWLFRNLKFHPEVWMPPVKELNYFNEVYFPSLSSWESQGRLTQASEALRHFEALENVEPWQAAQLNAARWILKNLRTDDWYTRIFSFAGDDMICGEISPEYALLPRAAISRIVIANPAIKILLILRDPILRAWSNIRMTARRAQENPESIFRDAQHWRVACGRSNYPAIIARWANFIPRNNLFVLSFDDLTASPTRFIERVCNSIGVDFDARFFPEIGTKVREGLDDELPEHLLKTMRADMRPIYERLMKGWPDMAGPWYQRHFDR